ncbi:uncharacterized protein LOC113650748 isoform X2 [Tachysurus fulvidraco]|uniref:uncharacterized protein LOC113650748 isoform X2 n=1 Tax=Tachysurus fulvidraco TaxID=1234273 RepID=UPI001FEE7929|nr:uncharacterized protein LOC113650748 isoform X2 [Tachysurus fulvidraco]
MVRKINEIQEKLTISGMHISAEISHPVINPVLPYRGKIPEGLKTDIAVVFQGILPADAKEFAVNFQTGESDGDDIAFHINPQIGDVVALNSFRNGSWETEEHASVTAYTKEEALNMSIAINSEGYEVYVNGLHHCAFNHRIPVENISTLGISGDVIIYYFGFVENWSDSSILKKMNEIHEMSVTSGSLIDVRPEISPSISNPKLNDSFVAVDMNKIQDTSLTSGNLIDVPAEISHPVSNPELPYVDSIPGGLKTDMAVVFQGALPADSKQFVINFQTSKNDGDDIAFNINPRIGDAMALNSFRNGSWETEEHASVTAFTKEEALNMSIAINSDGYEVYVNGLHQCTFNHRIPVENISTLGISGDVIIYYFGFVDNWSDSSIFKKMNEIHEMSVTSGSLIDVRPEISPIISNPELPNVGVIPQGLKTDVDVMSQVILPADANDAVYLNSIHHEPEKLNDSFVAVEMNKIQDTSLTNGNLIDVPAEISHPISNLQLIDSSVAVEMNKIQDALLTSGSLIVVPAEISHPVSNPELPYVDSIPGGLKTDMAVVFQGALPADSKQFAINFQTGKNDGDDIAFHINPRIGDVVALNSFRNASWETEEHASVTAFTKEEALNMSIAINSDGYEVYVNGLHQCTFNHRIPVENISTLGISGDVIIYYFGFVDNWSDSSIFKKLNEIHEMSVTSGSLIDVLPEISPIISNPELPNVGVIPQGLKTDVDVMFQVILPADANDAVNLNSIHHEPEKLNDSCVAVEMNKIQDTSLTSGNLIDVPAEISHPISNLQLIDSSVGVEMNKIQDTTLTSGSLIVVPAEISRPVSNPELPYVDSIPGGLKTDMAVVFQGALPADSKQFAINFQTGKNDGDDIAFHINLRIGDVVALNSFRNGSWETEEHASVTAFTKEEALNMSIAINSDGYEVYVNGLHHCTFNHRIPVENISTLGISGDIIIYYFGFVDNWSDSFIFKRMNEIHEMSVTTGSLIDVRPEISPINSNSELPNVGVIPQGLKTDVDVMFQVILPADANDAVNLNSIHHEPEKLNDSSVGVEMNKIQDALLTSGSLIVVPAEISHPFSNPELPYVHSIPGGLKTDMAVVFQGALPADSKQFAINFQTGKNDGDDIAFHINLRIGDVMALNSFRNGIWDTEEHASVTAFTKEEALNMSIAINSEGYEVYVNGLHHCTFNHRIPVENISTLGISGDIIIYYFGFVDNWSDSSIFKKMNDIHEMSVTTGSLIDVLPEISPIISNPELPNVGVIPQGLKTDVDVMFQVILPADANDAVNLNSIHHEPEQLNDLFVAVEMNKIQDTSLTSGNLIDVPAEISHPISNPELPYVDSIPGGLKTDMAVVFQGALPADSKQFAINFQTGKNDGDDIAFNINPRIGDVVALNSFRNGSWETEEHASVTAFTKEEALNMSIAINSDGYEVYVNGLHQCTFNHRIPVENISTLGISGDVIIYYFGFVENWSRSSLALENKEITEMTSVTLLPITSDKLALSFVSTIPGGIKADMGILFCGTVLEDSNEFEINFQTSQSTDDIAFNINPQIVRFLVLSSLRKGSRETEDLASDKGAAFNMFVVVRLEGYEVFVNGLQYCMFKHRVPLAVISSLGVRGDVFVNFIGVIDNWSSSSMVMERSCWRPIPIPSEVLHPVSNPVLPYVGVIPGKAKPDMAVFFQGALPADANEFIINFQTGNSDGDDIAFCINPHLGCYVAINSFRNGSWETEESVADKPFTKGAAFNMFVIIKSEHYEVYVNGLELCTFKHRIPLEKISVLGISGDVSINFIGFIETWSKFSFIIENNEITGMRNSSWRCSSHQMISTSS